MATTTDYTKMMKDMMGAMPMDTTAFTDMFKTQAALGEKMSKVALEAAEKSTEVSTKWTKATLAKKLVSCRPPRKTRLTTPKP